MCGIRSRCLLTLPERAARHLSRGDGDRQRDKTDALGMRTASDERPSTTRTTPATKHRRLHAPTRLALMNPPARHRVIGISSIWSPFISPPPDTPAPLAFWSCSCLAGPEAEELKLPGAGHLSQRHPETRVDVAPAWTIILGTTGHLSMPGKLLP